ncbi:MAG: PilZ domain-containing protein [Solirubrobacteraceae bacterium]
MREERRGFPRAQVSLPVMLTLGTGPAVRALTADVSGGGMLLTTSPLALNAVVEFALEIDPSEAPITGRARAVREHAHTQQALAFEHVSLASHMRLMQFIDGAQHAAALRGIRHQ